MHNAGRKSGARPATRLMPTIFKRTTSIKNRTILDYIEILQICRVIFEPTLEGGCAVHDISEIGSVSNRLLMPLKNTRDDYTELITILRDPDSQTLLRVVLLNPKASTHNIVPPNLVDAIGLCLRIPVSFFEVYKERQKFPKQAPCVSSVASFGAVGRTVFIMVHSYLPGRLKYPPVMLILGNPIPEKSDIYCSVLGLKLRTFSKSILRAPPVHDDLVWPKSYDLLLQSHLARHDSEPQSFKVVLLYSLLPLLEISFELLKDTYDRANEQIFFFFQHPSDDWFTVSKTEGKFARGVEQTRFQLRREIRRFEQCTSDFKRYFRNRLGVEHMKHFLVIEEEGKACVADAYGLEAEVRDWLQLQAGSLALEESKKSIQLSNLQIEESKRGMKMNSRSYTAVTDKNPLL